MTGGWDSAIWRFSTEAGGPFVLRIYRDPERMAGALREKAGMEAASTHGLPVPKIHAFGAWQELPAFVIDWCEGATLIRVIERRPWALWGLPYKFGQFQARIHAMPIPDHLREGTPDYWLNRLSAGEETNKILSSLDQFDLNCNKFVHGDMHPLNGLSDGREITAILDWTGVTAGDVRADLAWSTLLMRLAPMPPALPRPVAARLRVCGRPDA